MSTTYVNVDLRKLVMTRGEGICEYCLLAAEDTIYGLEIDHVISEKHGGKTEADNLACCCATCNRAKGTDVGSIHWDSGLLTRFFNPRTDKWSEHFLLSGSRIEPLTPIGAVTITIFGFNSEEQQELRQLLQRENRFPKAAALKRIQS